MKDKNLKILEITAFSAGFCGLWTRVLAESELLAKENAVYVFSSDISRQTKNKTAKPFEIINNVKIRRFQTKGNFGDNTFFWNYYKEALKLKPDVIITHAYRQYYSTLALKVARKLNIPCFLVTHAPFLDKKLRNWKLNLVVALYDNFVGKKILNKYTRIITITKWEIPYLLKLGAKKERIVYIPNGVPHQFFIQRREKEKKNTILFLGRVTPIKNIETLIKALHKTKQYKLDIAGPIEEPYGNYLRKLIKKLSLQEKVKFLGSVNDLKKKIKIIDEHEIFVLPSKREGMPQTLIEAMSRKKIVISSTNEGGKELINDKENGFLFEIGNYKQLSELLSNIQKMKTKEKNKIKNQAKKDVEKFSWNKIIKKIEQTIRK